MRRRLTEVEVSSDEDMVVQVSTGLAGRKARPKQSHLVRLKV